MLVVVTILYGVLTDVTLSSVQRDHANQREDAARYSSEYVAEQIQAECVQVPRTRTFTCVANPPDAGGDERYAQADLQAQQEMAEWALAMIFATIAGVIITATGVVFVAMTLHETRVMVGEAAKTTAAAEKAAKAAQDANAAFGIHSQRELRAYVNVASARITYDAVHDRWESRLTVQNFGQTPAYDVSIIGVLEVARWPIGFLKEIGDPQSDASRYVLGPSAVRVKIDSDLYNPSSFTLRLAAIDSGTWDKPSQRALVAHGKVVYRDVFEQIQVTNYKYYVGGNEGLRDKQELEDGRHGSCDYRMVAHRDGNDAT